MDESRSAGRSCAGGAQWTDLKQILESLGAKISLLAPVRGLPDLVFTANAAMIYQRRAILSHFRHPQRQGEEQYDAAWLAEHGFEVTRLARDDSLKARAMHSFAATRCSQAIESAVTRNRINWSAN